MSEAELPESPQPASRSLVRKSLAELEALATSWGFPRYRATQIFRWLHHKGAAGFDDMSDLSKEIRLKLASEATIERLELAETQRSTDGTAKLRFVTEDGLSIESVLIPDENKVTLCVSSQAGCALGCTFCATATMGLTRHLSTGEILKQVYASAQVAAKDNRKLTNLVFMGMGEPLHNYDETYRAFELLTHPLGANFSPRKITVSTAGVVPGIERLGRAPVRVQLAISLNATTDKTRSEIMPINKKWNLAALLGALKRYPLEPRRRFTFEYVLLAGINDTPADAKRLPGLLHGLRSKINLIPWNPHETSPFGRPSWERVFAFQRQVQDAGLPAYIRRPRGDDIAGACGQLANRAHDSLADLERLPPPPFAPRSGRKPTGDLTPASFLLREIQKS